MTCYKFLFATDIPLESCCVWLQELSDLAALLEADLQKASAAAKEAAAAKALHDARAKECQQVRGLSFQLHARPILMHA